MPSLLRFPKEGASKLVVQMSTYVKEEKSCEFLVQQFASNAPPGYQIAAVVPAIFPTAGNAHRYIVLYKCPSVEKFCEDIDYIKYICNN